MIESMIYDFAISVKQKLSADVNGRIKFSTYESIDTIIFQIYFKDFEFSYGVNNVSALVHDGKVSETVEDIENKYKEVLLKSFFKSSERKARELNKSLGIPEDDYVSFN